MNIKHKNSLDLYLKMKEKHQNLSEETEFLEEQVNQAQLNEFKLKVRQIELATTLQKLRRGEEDSEESEFEMHTVSKARFGAPQRDSKEKNYFRKIERQFSTYIDHLSKRNTVLKEQIMRK